MFLFLLSLERKYGLFIQMLHHPMPFFSITMIGTVLGFSRILDASFCAWAVNVSTEGWTHLVTELLSPFNQPTSWW